MSKDHWIVELKVLMPAVFCKDKSYFHQCFSFNATTCDLAATDAIENCLAQFRSQIPEQLHQPKDGSFWGTKIGVCARKSLETTLKRKRTDNVICNNPKTQK